MSIVLVILGLLAGGILVGQDLIQSARIRQTATELQQYQTAYTTFRGKYDCLPGDCANATSFFGTDAGGCPNGNGNGSAAGACNGDGDGTINGWSGTGNQENMWAWKHMALAQMIPGKYSGGSKCCLNPGVTTPASAYDVYTGYDLFTLSAGHWATFLGSPSYIKPNSIVLQIGSIPTTNTDFYWGPGFTAPVAQKLDTKFDDGSPISGKFAAVNAAYGGVHNANTTCLSGSSYSIATATGCTVYLLSY